MQRFDFSQAGGFPLTQDRLDWMQGAYIPALDALAGVCGANEPTVLSGVQLTAGSWSNGTVSDGWVFVPGEGLIPFVGGAFTSSNRGLLVQDLLTPLEYKLSGTHDTQIKRCLTIVAGNSSVIRDMSNRRFAVEMANANRTAWTDVNWVGGASGNPAQVRVDNMSRMVHIFGNCTRTYKSIVSSGEYETVLKNIPAPDPVEGSTVQFCCSFIGDSGAEFVNDYSTTSAIPRHGDFGKVLPSLIGGNIANMDGLRVSLPVVRHANTQPSHLYITRWSVSYHF